MTGPKQARYIAIATLYIAAIIIFLEGLGSEKKFLSATSWLPLAIMICLEVYDRWAWAWLPRGVPVVKGTWKVQLVSSWRDPASPDIPVTREGYLVCRQTASQLWVRLYTNESSSVSLATRLEKRGDGQFELSWIYENTPDILLHERSPIHFGSVIAQSLSDRRVTIMRGSYFTSRKTIGNFIATDRNPRTMSSLQGAESLFGVSKEVIG